MVGWLPRLGRCLGWLCVYGGFVVCGFACFGLVMLVVVICG